MVNLKGLGRSAVEASFESPRLVPFPALSLRFYSASSLALTPHSYGSGHSASVARGAAIAAAVLTGGLAMSNLRSSPGPAGNGLRALFRRRKSQNDLIKRPHRSCASRQPVRS